MEKPLRFVLIGCLWLAACASLPTKKPTADVGLVRADIVALGDIGPRLFGSQEEAEASQYIASRFKSLGYSPEVRVFLENYVSDVIAVKEGVSEDTIIVGAHYDSGAEGGTKGADDNASGVAVMLEVARMLKNVKTPYTIKFIAFGAHEPGFLGSSYYVHQMTEAEKAKTIVVVLVDGLLAGDYAYVYGGDGEGGRIRDWLLGWAKQEGLPLQTQTGHSFAYPAGTAPPRGDHVPFKEAGIPYVWFNSANWLLGEKDGWTQFNLDLADNGQLWHTKYDNLAWIDSTFPGRVDEHLRLYSSALYKTLVEYRVPASSQ
jgi:Zn-dependent M28 family amino/carboxypeptidase